MVHGVRIPVTEERMAIVTRFPTTGETWFKRKAHILDTQKGFLVDNEQVHTKGQGADVSSLPEP
jgi:hypothetical protein